MKYQICTSLYVDNGYDGSDTIVEMDSSLFPLGQPAPKGLSYCHNSKHEAVETIKILKKELSSHYDFYIIEKY